MIEIKETGYELSRNWFDWSFENRERINPNHTALYFFILEYHNRMGRKDKFGFPMELAKESIGISNYKTYSKTFNDLIDFGFIKIYQKSKNQFTANIIGLVKNTKAHTKALAKASPKQLPEQDQKQVQSIVGIDKQENKETIKINKQVKRETDFNFDFVSIKFSDSFFRFLDYRKKIHKEFKTQMSLEACYSDLMELSGRDPAIVSKIVEQTIRNQWQGLFELKEKNSEKKENGKQIGTKAGQQHPLQNLDNLATGILQGNTG